MYPFGYTYYNIKGTKLHLDMIYYIRIYEVTYEIK